MAPKKSSTANNCKECLNWTRFMDDALIDAFMHEYNEGHKVNGTFTSAAYDNIVKELSVLFGPKINKERVKNRWKTLKKNFSEFCDIFKSGLGGFVWNPSTHLWDAGPQVWDALIESKPKAAMWRNTPFPNYDKIVILYGNDRATRKDVKTTSEMRKRRHSTTEEDFAETINDIGNLVSQNEATIENFEAFLDVGNNAFNPSVQDHSRGETNGCNKKKQTEAVTNEKDSEVNEIKGVITEVAEAIREGNQALREGNVILRESYNHKLRDMSGRELWKMIKECGCDVDKIPKIYRFLMTYVDQLLMVLECPPEARKEVIMDMVFGS